MERAGPARPVGGAGDLEPALERTTRARERRLIFVGMLAMFAFSVQQTTVSPTLPALERDFETTTAWSTWVITAFIFVGAVTIPLVGRLADQFGRKPLLQWTLGVFGAASLGAALAPNIGVLIVCRGVSGVSGVFLALCLALATQHVRPHRVAAAVSATAAALAFGNVVGVTIAPVVADQFSWRWMFVAVALLAIGALVLSVRSIPPGHIGSGSTVDVKGAALLTLGIGSFMLALTQGNAWGWASPPILGLFATAIAAVIAWTYVELSVAEPMIDLRILRRATVAMTVSATFLAGFGVFSWFMLVPRLVAAPRGAPPELAGSVGYGFGADSTTAGLFMLPGMLVSLALASSLGVVAARLSWRMLLVAILAVLALAFAGLAVWHEERWQIFLLMAFCGVGGPISSVAGKLVADDVPREDHGLVSGLTMVSYYVGGVLGAQICAAVLTGHTIGTSAVPTEAAYAACFLLCAATAALAVPFALLARPNRGASRASRPSLAGETGR